MLAVGIVITLASGYQGMTWLLVVTDRSHLYKKGVVAGAIKMLSMSASGGVSSW